MSEIYDTPRTAEDAIVHARALAATAGCFRPETVWAALKDWHPDLRKDAMAALAHDAAEINHGGHIYWMMSSDARRGELIRLQGDIGLAVHELTDLFKALKLDASDRYGDYLRKALTGNLPSTPPAGDADLYYTILEFVGRSRLGVAPQESQKRAVNLRRDSAIVLTRSDLDATIGPVFVGRRTELTKLRAFVENDHVSLERMPLFIVSGAGGSGKSALLAKFIKALRREEDGPVVITLDFDRPSLATLDPVELTNEYLRQLALWRPRLEERLRALRHDLAQDHRAWEESGVATDFTRRFEARAGRAFETIAELNYVLSEANPKRPILLVLDTFEEIVVRGPSFVEAAIRWTDTLALRGSVSISPKIMTIISGREGLEQSPLQSGHVVGRLVLGELSPKQAVRVLGKSDIAPDIAAKLVNVYGANPLVLRLLGDFCRGLPKKELRALVQEGAGRARFDDHAAQRVLYSRILGRIRDPQIEALASPGLIVRRVTPDTIRRLLNIDNVLGDLNANEAQALFQRLVKQVWLVSHDSDYVATHRTDLRRLMLPFMDQDKARALHERAADYYARGEDSYLSAELQAKEAMYHRLFADPDEALKDASVASYALGMGQIDDLPPRTRALIKLRRQRGLTEAEEAALNKEERTQYRRTRLRQSAIAGMDRVAANSAPSRVISSTRRPGDDSDDDGIDTVHTLFSRCQFERVTDQSRPIVEDFIKRALAPKSSGFIYEDFTASPIWTLALSALATKWSPIEPVREIRARLSGRSLRQRWLDHQLPISGSDFLDALEILFAGHLGRTVDAPDDIEALAELLSVRSSIECRKLDVLRTLQLLTGQGLDLPPGQIRLESSLICDMSEKFAPELWGGPSSDYPYARRDSGLRRARAVLAANKRPSINDWRQIEKASAQLPHTFELADFADHLAAIGTLTPELYAPLRRELAPNAIRRAVAEELARLAPFWPVELHEKTLSDSAVSTLVQFADRAGLLSKLVEIAQKNGADPAIGRLYRSYVERLKPAPRPPARKKAVKIRTSPARPPTRKALPKRKK